MRHERLCIGCGRERADRWLREGSGLRLAKVTAGQFEDKVGPSKGAFSDDKRNSP